MAKGLTALGDVKAEKVHLDLAQLGFLSRDLVAGFVQKVQEFQDGLITCCFIFICNQQVIHILETNVVWYKCSLQIFTEGCPKQCQ